MAFHSYREGSRTNWGVIKGDAKLTIEQINCGALLRIADAVELMAKRYTDLIDQRDHQQRRADRLEESLYRLHRSNAALRGHLKRAKKGAM